ncbi:MAG: ATP synthase F0 subunit C [Pirellulaceae bacterium]|nr:ATP synthase F0 subunit C [Pirellulaceae bacterium]MDP7015064.1 ATP synthase F0 subunit C [Pirellulaceae bacterium]
MNTLAKIGFWSIAALLVCVTPALAQTAGDPINAAPLGVGLTVIGAAYGIGRLASSALESMARQPEVAGNVQVAMIIAAALIEGFTFFALFICMQQAPT